MRKLLTIALGLALGAAVFTAPTVQAADKAPAFTLRNIDNQEVNLSDYEGQVVLINFWATWCAPCLVEMTHIEKMYTEYKDDGFVVLAISADDARSASKVKPMVRSKRWTFPVLLDKETKVVAQYNPNKTLPYNALIDANGDLIWSHQGYTPGDEKELEVQVKAAVDALKASKATSPEAPTLDPGIAPAQ